MKLTYAKCEQLIQHGRNGRKKLDHNTYLYKQGQDFVVKLHNNQIMKIYLDGNISVSNCGWLTRTTKDRLNKYTDLGIYQRKGVWYCASGLEFVSGMLIQRPSMVEALINEFQLNQQTNLQQGRFL